jgi:hypothetical protein
MKSLIAVPLLISMFSLGITGCAEKEQAKSETKITGPGGTTTIKHETDVKQTGKNPPSETP